MIATNTKQTTAVHHKPVTPNLDKVFKNVVKAPAWNANFREWVKSLVDPTAQLAQLDKALDEANGQAKAPKLKGLITKLQDQMKAEKKPGVSKRRAMLKEIHARLETENKEAKKSSSIRPDGTRRDHCWVYQGGKAGGVHGAGEEGGVHALQNADGEFVDLDGNVLNVLSDDGRAIDLDKRKFTVLRDDATNKINRVRYDDGEERPVTMDETGQQLIGNDEVTKPEVVIAKFDKPELALIKQELLVAKTMTEYIGSVVFRSRHPESFPEVHLVDTSHRIEDRKPTDIYVASVYLKDYKDGFKEFDKRNGRVPRKEKPMTYGITSKSQKEIRKAILKDDEGYSQLTDFGPATVPSLRANEFDGHPGNVGVQGGAKLVRIDLAGTWRQICKHHRLRPHSISEHPIGRGPLNRFAQYHVSLKTTPEFVAELDADVAHDYRPSIEKALEDLTHFYDAASFRALADWVGIDAKDLPRAGDGSITNDVHVLAACIASNVVKAYEARGTDMSRFSAQLKSDLCAASAKKEKWELGGYKDAKGKTVSFENVVIEHQDYFREVIAGTEVFKFRDKAHAKYKKLALNEAKRILDQFDAQLASCAKKNGKEAA